MGEYIDVTMAAYDGMMGFPVPWVLDYEISSTAKHQTHNRAVTKVVTSTHTGTHIDLPYHFLKDGDNLDQYPINEFIGKGFLLDFSFKNSLEGITKQDLEEKEKRFGIHKGDIVILRTDWSDNFGTEDFFNLAPYIDSSAATLLADKQLKAVGVDTASVEDPRSINPEIVSPIHKIMLGSGMYIIESLTDLKKIREGSIEVIAFPLKIKEADGSPARVAIRPID